MPPCRCGPAQSSPARPRPVVLPEDAPTLATVATAAATDPGWIAADSTTDAILSAGFTFTIGNVTVVVGARPTPQSSYIVETFADAVRGFADLGVAITAYELGRVNADAPGLLIAGATAHSAHYVVTGTATLADNPSGTASADLIAANLATPDLFEPGTLLWLGAFGTGIAPAIVPATGETLADFARRHLCTAAEVLGANAALEVIPDTGLAIPGAVALADWNAVAVPYTLRADDILSGVAAGFDLADAPDKATDLAARNADLPGTVAQDISFDVRVGGTLVPVHTAGLFSFAAGVVRSSAKPRLRQSWPMSPPPSTCPAGLLRAACSSRHRSCSPRPNHTGRDSSAVRRNGGRPCRRQCRHDRLADRGNNARRTRARHPRRDGARPGTRSMPWSAASTRCPAMAAASL